MILAILCRIQEMQPTILCKNADNRLTILCKIWYNRPTILCRNTDDETAVFCRGRQNAGKENLHRAFGMEKKKAAGKSKKMSYR